MALSNPESVSRIRSPSGLRASHLDLDIYNDAFHKGMGLSPKFKGTDIDGLFGLLLHQDAHGLWERNGHVLIQEHKLHSPEDLDKGSGQFRAFSALAGISPDRIHVIYTFGASHTPIGQRWRRVWARGRMSAVFECTADFETWPHRQWIRKIVGKSNGDLPIDATPQTLEIVDGDPPPSMSVEAGAFSCFHCGKLTTETYSVGSLHDAGDSYRMCAICWRAGIEPEQSKRQWAAKVAKQIRETEPPP